MMEWIDHDGSGYPELPPRTMVKVRFADGLGSNWSAKAWEFWKPDADDPQDYWVRDKVRKAHNLIVAYQVQD